MGVAGMGVMVGGDKESQMSLVNVNTWIMGARHRPRPFTLTIHESLFHSKNEKKKS